MTDPRAQALLSLFSVCDDVFSEEDRFASDEVRKMTLGRIYREYKKARLALQQHAERFGARPS